MIPDEAIDAITSKRTGTPSTIRTFRGAASVSKTQVSKFRNASSLTRS